MPGCAWRAGFVLALSFGLLVLHALQYWPFLSDDALISLRYADRLLAGHGLTWTEGAAVEGYSNLLWILLAAALGGLGLDLIDAVRVLGGLCMLAVLGAVACVHRRDEHPLAGLAASGVIAGSGSLAVWTIGGLEQPLLAALLAWSLVAVFPILDGTSSSLERALLAGLPLALLCWTRPDAPLLVACFGLAVVVVRGRSGWIRAVWIGLLPGAAVLAQLGFRLLYYDDWVPNPAHIKTQVSLVGALAGVDYVARGALYHAPVLALGALGVHAAWREPRLRGRVLLLAGTGLVWMGYVVLIGGDIFPGRRHLVPLVVLLAFLAGEAVRWVQHTSHAGRRVASLVCVSLAGFAGLQQLDGANGRARRERWVWDGQVIGWLLRDAFEPVQPLVAVTAAGTVPYFSGLPALDLLGLNDRHIARTPALEGARLAHDHTDASYALDRAPDLILLGKPPGKLEPESPAERQIFGEPRFLASYLPVHLEGREPHAVAARMWARKEGRVGITSSDGERFVPAYLLQSEPPIQGRLDPLGRIVSELPERTPARISFALEAGTWTLESMPAVATLQIRIEDGAGGPIAQGGPPLRFELATAQTIRLEATAASETLLHGFRLRR